MPDSYMRDMFARILQLVDEHPELTGDVAFESTPTGIIAMSPADLAHGRVVESLRDQLGTGLSDRGENLAVGNDAGFLVAGQRKIPDLFVLDYDKHAPESDGYVQGADGVWLFAEVTSRSTRATDLGLGDPTVDSGKPDVYAGGNVPVYLVVDRHMARVLVYSEPMSGRYPDPAVYPIGQQVWLPQPFSFWLETQPLKAFM